MTGICISMSMISERMAVGQRAGRQIDADLSVLGNGNVGACSFQDEANQALIVRAVLGNQDRSALERELGLLCRALRGNVSTRFAKRRTRAGRSPRPVPVIRFNAKETSTASATSCHQTWSGMTNGLRYVPRNSRLARPTTSELPMNSYRK